MLRTKSGKSSRLFISILVTQHHIESIRKPILLKGDEVFLNGLLAQVLSDIAPNPPATFSIQIFQNTKLKLGPIDSFYPEPPSSYDRDTLMIQSHRYGSRSHRDCLANFLILVVIISVSLKQQSVSPRWLDQHIALFLHFGLSELMQSVPPRHSLP